MDYWHGRLSSGVGWILRWLQGIAADAQDATPQSSSLMPFLSRCSFPLWRRALRHRRLTARTGWFILPSTTSRKKRPRAAPNSTRWPTDRSSRVNPGASAVSHPHRRLPSGAGSPPRPSRIPPQKYQSGNPSGAGFDVIPVYRNCYHFPFGHYPAPFELKTCGTNRADLPRLQAISGKGRFRNIRAYFLFGK